MNVVVEIMIKNLCFIVDYFDQVWKDCKFVFVVGSSVGILGGLLIVGGGVVIVMMVGVVVFLLIMGVVIGVVGVCINFGVNIVEGCINFFFIQVVDGVVENVNCVINNVREKICLLKNGKSQV